MPRARIAASVASGKSSPTTATTLTCPARPPARSRSVDPDGAGAPSDNETEAKDE